MYDVKCKYRKYFMENFIDFYYNNFVGYMYIFMVYNIDIYKYNNVGTRTIRTENIAQAIVVDRITSSLNVVFSCN